MIIYSDVRTLTADRLLEDCGKLPSVIVGSPPCQDASVANSRGDGVDGERTGLFFEAIRIVGECRPVWCCFENVPGLRTRGIDRVLDGLEAEGYTPWPLVVGARHVGAPHKRDRVWIVAADAAQVGCGPRPSWGPDTGVAGEREQALSEPHAADAAQVNCDPGARQDIAFAEPASVSAADADGPGLAQREGESGDDDAELPPALRAIGRAWHSWPHSLARCVQLADGIPARVARACIAAFGDAVVPQIPEAIGRVMMSMLPTGGDVLDLFCGAAGGWSLGMHRAGYKTVAACEIDPWRREVFMNHNWDMV